MAADAKKIERSVRATLAPDERIVAVVQGYPRGTVEKAIAAGAGGVALGVAGFVAGDALGGRTATPHHEAASEAGVETARAGAGVVAALTSGRLLVWRAGMLGKPKELLGALDREQIAAIEMGERSLFGQRMPEVVVRTENGGELGIGVGKVHRRKAEAFVAAFTS